jgi:hypothetical protein
MRIVPDAYETTTLPGSHTAQHIACRCGFNLKPVRLFVTGTQVVPGLAAMWTLETGKVQALAAINLGGSPRSLDELVEVIRAPTFRERLAVCLEIRTHQGAPLDLKLSAQLESAICYMHLGATEEALLDGQELQAAAASDPSLKDLGYAAAIVHHSAQTKLRLVSNRSASRPGSTNIAKLARLTSELPSRHLTGALHLIGGWHGLVGDAAEAEKMLRRAKALADDSEEGHYQEFVSEFRLAELCPADERPDRAYALRPLAAALNDVAQEPAMVLIDRMERGLDTSIATSVHRTADEAEQLDGVRPAQTPRAT